LLTNADLEKMVETNDEWIQTRTGIRERHIVEPGTPTSDLAVEAAKVCLKNRGIGPEEIDAIIVATVTPDMMFPATACVVQDKLGAKNAWGFDLSAACSGYLYALQIGAKLVESGAQKKVLIIGADVMSSIVDYTDRSTCILFGDGAGATLIEVCEGDEVGVVDYVHEVDGSGGNSLNMPGGGSAHPASHATIDAKQHYVHQDGGSVYKVAVRKMAELSEQVLQRNEITGADIQCFIPHQANRRIIEATADRLGMPLERVVINIDRYGNTTAGTIPLAMDTAVKEGRLKKGDLVLLASFGGGYTIGSTLLRWEF
jgi:3-oxoacyl-[acyl-carrier-protein] synthase-3